MESAVAVQMSTARDPHVVPDARPGSGDTFISRKKLLPIPVAEGCCGDLPLASGVTASPTYTIEAIGIVSVPCGTQALPSEETNPMKLLPARTSSNLYVRFSLGPHAAAVV